MAIHPANFAVVAELSGLPMFFGTEAIDRIEDGWRRALIGTDPQQRSAVLQAWMSAHRQLSEDGQSGDANQLLELLAVICRLDGELLDALFNANRDWLDEARDDADRLSTARLIDQMIRSQRGYAQAHREEAVRVGPADGELPEERP